MKSYLLLLFLLFSASLHAQRVTLSGRALQSGSLLPVAGASVQLVGQSIAVLTDSSGRFRVPGVQLPDTLVISHTGFSTQHLFVGAFHSPLTVRLSPLGQLLEEVVVSNGYQKIPKERITGSVVKIDNALLNRTVSSNILNRLEGVTSGLLVDKRMQGPGGGPLNANNLIIRGISTITESIKAPLIVLDNFPFTGDINSINPNDIDNVVVLRDAAAASIWGARAANGVIVVTTKKGQYNQPTRLSLNSNCTVSQKPNLYHYPQISSTDFIGVERFLFDKGYYDAYLPFEQFVPFRPVVELLDASRSGTITPASAEAQIAALEKQDVRQDFSKYFYRRATAQQYALNLSGGSSTLHYYLSGGLDKSLESLVGNSSERKSFTYGFNVRPVPKLTLQLSGLYTDLQSRNNAVGGYGDLSISSALGAQDVYPYAQLADASGNPLPVAFMYGARFTDTAGGGKLLDWKWRPLQELRENDRSAASQHFLTTIGLGYTLLPSLSVDVKYQYQRENTTSRNYYSLQSFTARNLINTFTQINGDAVAYIIPVDGILDETHASMQSHSIRGQLNFQQTFSSKHLLTGIAGAEVREAKTNSSGFRTYGYSSTTLTTGLVDYVNQYPLYGGIGNSRIPELTSFSQLLDRFVSGFANASYVYDNRYVLSASARKDASNLFGVATNNKGKPFWSVGGAWNVSREPFYISAALPYIQLKLSYGYNGNVNNSLSAYTLLSYAPASNNLINAPFAVITQPADRSLTWETTRTINGGLSFGLKNNVVSGSVEGYVKRTSDLISFAVTDPTTGVGVISSLRRNNGNMSARGVDVALNSKNISRRFSWTTNFLLSYAFFKVTKLNKDDRTPTDKVGLGNAVVYDGTALIPIVDKNPYGLYSYRWAQLDAQTGNPIGFIGKTPSQDYSGILSGATYGDLVYHGAALPAYFGALINTFSYAGISLSVNLQYKFGYYFRKPSLSYYSLYTNGRGQPEFANRWQKPGDELHTHVPSMIYPLNDPYRDNFYQGAEVNVRRGDHVRLQDIRLNFDWIQHVQVYCVATNLGLIWTANKEKIDPDYNAVSTYYPPVKSITLGVKLDF